MGEVSMALVQAAQFRPGTVVQLAERACVGYDVARFKAKDLVRAGVLVPMSDERPRVLAVAQQRRPVRREASVHDYLTMLDRSFWGSTHGA